MAKFVHEIMNRELLSLRPTEEQDRALGYILALGITGAPVVDETGKPLGMVSIRDLLRAKAGPQVSECMTTPAATVEETATVHTAAERLGEYGVHRLVVVDDVGRAVGVVSALDLVRALIGMPAAHPDAFPHLDKITGLSWTNPTLLDLEHTDVAPTGAGILILSVGGTDMPETDVWIEATNNVQARLHDILSLPQSEPRLSEWLEHPVSTPLRFRAAAVPDAGKRRRALQSLLDRARAEIRRPA